MSFCLNTLTQEEQDFIAACALPFTCFDGFVVEESTPHRDIQLLFHFHALASRNERQIEEWGRDAQESNSIYLSSDRLWCTHFRRWWGDFDAVIALLQRHKDQVLRGLPKVNIAALLGSYEFGTLMDLSELSEQQVCTLLDLILPTEEELEQGLICDVISTSIIDLLLHRFMVRTPQIQPEMAERLVRFARCQTRLAGEPNKSSLLYLFAEQAKAQTAEQAIETGPLLLDALFLELQGYTRFNVIEGWMAAMLNRDDLPELKAYCERSLAREVRHYPATGDLVFLWLSQGADFLPDVFADKGRKVKAFVPIHQRYDDLGYPLFEQDPYAEAETWVSMYIRETDLNLYEERGFSWREVPEGAPRQLEGLELSLDNPFCHQLLEVCIRRLIWTSFVDGIRQGQNSESHEGVLELMRRLLDIPGMLDMPLIQRLVAKVKPASAYLLIEHSLFKHLPGVINPLELDNKLAGPVLERLGAYLSNKEFDEKAYKHKNDAWLVRQYLGWIADDIQHPIEQVQALFPEYGQGELVAVSDRGMPIYASGYAQTLQTFESEVFRIPQNGDARLSFNTDYAEGSPVGVMAKQKNPQLATHLRPVLLGYFWSGAHGGEDRLYHKFLKAALRKTLPLTEDDVYLLLSIDPWDCASGIFKNTEAYAKKSGLTPRLRKVLEDYHTYDNKIKQRISKLLSEHSGQQQEADQLVRISLVGRDLVATLFNGFIQDLPEGEAHSKAWIDLLELCSKSNATKPAKKALTEMQQAIEVIGDAVFVAHLSGWLESITAGVEEMTNKEISNEEYWLHWGIEDTSRSLLKGLAWTTSLVNSIVLEQAWASFAADIGYNKKSWGQAENVGNAVLWLLGASQNLASVGMLTRIRAKVSSAATKKLIAKQISAAAGRFGITPAELEDMAAPDHGLVNGRREGELCGYRYQLGFVEGDSAKLLWINDKGKVLKSVPQKVKDEQGEELKALRADLKAMQADLAAQKLRLDRELNAKRSWSPDKFNAYYHEHPLMQLIAHGLIWRFVLPQGEVSAFYLNQNWVNAEGEGVDVSAATEVSLWHPLEQDEVEIIAWREFIRREGIKQPLKQAYRELYLLTDAERNTGDHSLRMAGHILKQHQFTALARLRGWRYTMMTCWSYEPDDTGFVAELELPQYGLRATLQILEPYDSDDVNEDTGMYTHAITDRVRFFEVGSDVAMNMADIPARALSEVLRDCDLFVGVASIGNDPNWNPDRHQQGYNAYWSEYSFGELREAAKLRRSVLENILPSLAIADKCRIQDRFLHVQGTRGEYKIHIGSTNILMAPDDEYLCIVPERKAQKQSENVMLPFEGDSGFALLLSKAMMLANDDKIKDPTILSQLKTKQALAGDTRLREQEPTA